MQVRRGHCISHVFVIISCIQYGVFWAECKWDRKSVSSCDTKNAALPRCRPATLPYFSCFPPSDSKARKNNHVWKILLCIADIFIEYDEKKRMMNES